MSRSRDSRQKTGRWSPRATPQPQPRAAKPEAELLASPSDHSARKHSGRSAADPGRRGPDREVSGHCHARGPARTRPTARAGEGGCGRLGPPSLPRASLCLPAALPHASPLPFAEHPRLTPVRGSAGPAPLPPLPGGPLRSSDVSERTRCHLRPRLNKDTCPPRGMQTLSCRGGRGRGTMRRGEGWPLTV